MDLVDDSYFELDIGAQLQSNLRFRISDLRCRIRPISNF